MPTVPATQPRKANEIDRHVSARIRVRRRLLGLSQVELAARIGVSFQQIQKYEQCVTRVVAGRLQQFAEALEVPIWYFYVGATAEGDGGDTLLPLSDDAFRLSRSLAMLKDPRTRWQVVALAEALVGDQGVGRAGP